MHTDKLKYKRLQTRSSESTSSWLPNVFLLSIFAKMDSDNSQVQQRVIENEQRLYAQEKLFYEKMERYASAKNSKMNTADERSEIISTLRNWETLSSKEKDGKQYSWKTKYDFVQLGNAEEYCTANAWSTRLVTLQANFLLDKVVHAATFEELFECLHVVCLSVGHGKSSQNGTYC